MYDEDFDAWTQAHYADPNQCYSGGVKWLNETSNEKVETLCRALSNGREEYKDLVLFGSCLMAWTGKRKREGWGRGS